VSQHKVHNEYTMEIENIVSMNMMDGIPTRLRQVKPQGMWKGKVRVPSTTPQQLTLPKQRCQVNYQIELQPK
jgi:hypothetical protein